MEQMQAIDGRVTAVRGAVLDVAFEGATLPPIDDALLITPGNGAPIIAEVQSHLDEATVRAIALQSRRQRRADRHRQRKRPDPS